MPLAGAELWQSALACMLDEEGNTKEGGIQVEGAVLMPSYMKNDEAKLIPRPAAILMPSRISAFLR